MKLTSRALVLVAIHASTSSAQATDTSSNWNVVAGGTDMVMSPDARYSVIGGGYKHTVSALYATIAGGVSNKVYSNYGTVSGGFMNKVRGRFATVLGGVKNTASGRYSVALGYQALATGEHSAAFGFTEDFCIASEPGQVKFCSSSTTLAASQIAIGTAASATGANAGALNFRTEPCQADQDNSLKICSEATIIDAATLALGSADQPSVVTINGVNLDETLTTVRDTNTALQTANQDIRNDLDLLGTKIDALLASSASVGLVEENAAGILSLSSEFAAMKVNPCATMPNVVGIADGNGCGPGTVGSRCTFTCGPLYRATGATKYTCDHLKGLWVGGDMACEERILDGPEVSWSDSKTFNTMTSADASEGLMHGPWDGSTQNVYVTLDVPRTANVLRVSMRYWAIDSWDTEPARVYVDNNRVWDINYVYTDCDAAGTKSFTEYTGGANIPDPWAGQGGHQCYYDILFFIETTRRESVYLRLYGGIGSAASDESWGITRFEVTPLEKILSKHIRWDNTKTTATETQGVIQGPYDNKTPQTGTWITIVHAAAIRLQMRFWAMDTWDAESAKVTVGNTRVFEAEHSGTSDCAGFTKYDGTDIPAARGLRCYADVDKWVMIRPFWHGDKMLKQSFWIRAESNIGQDQTDESWAFSNFQISFGEKSIVAQGDDIVYSNAVVTQTGGTEGELRGLWGGDSAGIDFVTGAIKDPSNKWPTTPHFRTVKLRYWAIDSWDREKTSMSIDGVELFSSTFVYNDLQEGYFTEYKGSNSDIPDPWNGNDNHETYIDLSLAARCKLWNYASCGNTFSAAAGIDSAKSDESWAISKVAFQATDVITDTHLRWSRADVYVTNGDQYLIHGPFDKNSQSITTTVPVPKGATSLKVMFRFWALDSWDGEWARAKMDGVEKWSDNIRSCAGSNTGGYTEYGGYSNLKDPWSTDGAHQCYQDIEWDHKVVGKESVSLEIRGECAQTKDDESWSFNMMRIIVS